MATKIVVNKSNEDMNRQFAQEYLNSNTEEEYEEMADNWGISIEEIFDIIDAHPEYLDLVDDEAGSPMNFSGAEVETEKDDGMLLKPIKPMDKTHLAKDEFITKKQTTVPEQYEKTSQAGSGNRGADGSLLTEVSARKPLNFSGVEVDVDAKDPRKNSFTDGNRPLNFKAAADNKEADNKAVDDKPIDGKSSLPVIEIIKAPEAAPEAEPEERPGWKKEDGANFWTINSESPHWKTEEGGMEAEKLWGSRPSWVKQR